MLMCNLVHTIHIAFQVYPVWKQAINVPQRERPVSVCCVCGVSLQFRGPRLHSDNPVKHSALLLLLLLLPRLKVRHKHTASGAHSDQYWHAGARELILDTSEHFVSLALRALLLFNLFCCIYFFAQGKDLCMDPLC